MKKLIVKSVVKVLIIVLLLVTVSALSALPMINNQLAMGQLENSNTAYIVWSTYNKMKSAIDATLYCISALIIGTIAVDVHKFVKNKNNNEREND